MSTPWRFSDIRFAPATVSERAAGLLGFVSVRYGSLRLEGLTVRQSRAGRRYVSLPERMDRHGVVHPLVRPLDADARTALEAAVLAELAARGVLP